jgi:hypothetical protein
MVLWKLVNFSVPHSSTCTSEALIASIAYVLWGHSEVTGTWFIHAWHLATFSVIQKLMDSTKRLFQFPLDFLVFSRLGLPVNIPENDFTLGRTVLPIQGHPNPITWLWLSLPPPQLHTLARELTRADVTSCQGNTSLPILFYPVHLPPRIHSQWPTGNSLTTKRMLILSLFHTWSSRWDWHSTRSHFPFVCT